ncbi:MAG: Wzz/FepE/Etk N-terminal domain-containing protein [Ferruginibacter sp.]
MDLIYFIKVLYRRKWIIIGISLLAVAVAFIFLFYKKPLYSSQAQYSTGFTTEKVRVIDGNSGIDIYSADVKFNNAIETFKSPKVVNTIAYKLLLHDLVNPQKAYKKLSNRQKETQIYRAVNNDTAIKTLTLTLQQHRILGSETDKERILLEYFKMFKYDYESMLDYLTVERVGRTDYLNMTFRSENPELSAWVVNAMGQEFLNYYKDLTSQRTEENAQDIKKMVSSQEQKIDSLGKQLYGEKVKQGSIDPVSLSTSAMETVKELETKLAEEKSKQNEHFNRKKYLTENLNVLQAGMSASTPKGNNNDIIALTNKKNDLVAEYARKGGNDPAMQKQIDDLKNEINQKSSTGSSKNNTAKQKQIDDLKTQISEEDAMFNAANSTVADYSNRIRKYTGMANSAPVGSDVTISGIQSKIDIENKQLGIVLDKYNQAKSLVKDDPTTNFIQTAIGQPAIGPESKKTLLTMLLSGASMFFLTSVIFLLLEVFDSKLKTPLLFKKQIKTDALNVLNMVPLKKISEEEIITNDFEGKKFDKEIKFKNNIRKLRYELLKSPHKSYLITSTQKQTGKTTVIETLGASLVLSQQKVLLIDMNFAHNSLTQKYNPDSLVENIAGKINYSAPLTGQKLWSSTPLEGMYIIGCNQANTTPSEALYKLDIKEFLKFLKNDFDYILIEGAALNNYADSQELSTYADAVITVFSAAAAINHADENALKFIASLKEKNTVTILNKVLKENINF